MKIHNGQFYPRQWRKLQQGQLRLQKTFFNFIHSHVHDRGCNVGGKPKERLFSIIVLQREQNGNKKPNIELTKSQAPTEMREGCEKREIKKQISALLQLLLDL